MKPGEHPPKGVKELVLRLAGRDPRPTNRVIQQSVKERFGVTVHEKTIRRYCKQAELPTSSRLLPQQEGEPTAPEEGSLWSLQMEQSGHWPALRETAKRTAAQVDAPLPHLLSLTEWHAAQREGWHNHALTVNNDNTVSVGVEEEVLFSALQEHLPRHPAFELLNQWKEQVGEVLAQLTELRTRASKQPEITGRCVIRNTRSGKSGLTGYFVKTAVLNAVEDAYHGSRTYQQYIVESYLVPPDKVRASPPVGKTRVAFKAESFGLEWHRGPLIYLLAVTSDRSEADRLCGLHRELVQCISGWPEVTAVVKRMHGAKCVQKELVRELHRIAERAHFPGSCGLCKE